jgi:hypothetical protein
MNALHGFELRSSRAMVLNDIASSHAANREYPRFVVLVVGFLGVAPRSRYL